MHAIYLHLHFIIYVTFSEQIFSKIPINYILLKGKNSLNSSKNSLNSFFSTLASCRFVYPFANEMHTAL